MLKMCVTRQPKRWDEFLPLLEFAYKNVYQESLKMSPFEALCGRKCNTPISWGGLVNKLFLRTDMPKEMEHEIVVIK